jgi:hypothetical protein
MSEPEGRGDEGAADREPAEPEHEPADPESDGNVQSGSADRLAELRRELDGLGDTPLSAHPEVLERTHRVLVEQLEALEHWDDGEEAG